MTTSDLARCAQLASKFKIRREELAEILNVTRERLKEVTVTRTAISPKNGHVIVRRPMAHLAGKKLTKRQEEAVTKVGGHPAVYYANCLIELLESNSLPDDEKLFEKLRTLSELLESRFAAT